MRFDTRMLILALSIPMAAHAQPDLLGSWEADAENAQFGIAVALGGDGNGDGRGDLAVGSNTSDIGAENTGAVSLYYGRLSPQSDPDLVLSGEPGSFFGSAVAWGGDVDDDGFDDLLVGAFRDSILGPNTGRAYLFLGGDPMDFTPDLVLAGPGAGSYFGQSVSGAGDLNMDGYADFAVGAARTDSGTVYVYFGGSSPDGNADLVIQGPGQDSRFGRALAGPGNVDGVAGPDLIVGAPRYGPDHTWQGGIFLLSGGAALDNEPDWSYLGEGGGDELGTSVAGAGDVNGDGTMDFVAGAPFWNNGNFLDAGAAYVFFGGSPLPAAPDFTFEGSSSSDNLGRSVAGCGDVTGSGFSHVLVGIPKYDEDGMDTGRILLSPGGDPPQGGDELILAGENAGDQFGFAVAGAAAAGGLSFSGSARPDLAIGAWSFGVGGKAYLYGEEGSSGAPGAPDPGDRLSVSLAGNPSGSLRFSLESAREARRLSFVVLDPRGRLVTSRALPPGVRRWNWSGTDDGGRSVGSGVYFYRIEGQGVAPARGRLILLR